MFQVPVKMDPHGLAKRGLLIRHLVLPNDLANTQKVLAFLAREISPATYINLMDQYHPCYRADEYPELNRRLSPREYQQARKMAEMCGLNRLDKRRKLWF